MTEERATKFIEGTKYRYCSNCDARQYAAIPPTALTNTDKRALTAAKKFFKALKNYNVKAMKAIYVTKTRDFMAGYYQKIYKKQFKKKFEYDLINISSTKKTAKIRVNITAPYAYNRFSSADEAWYKWYVKHYRSVSEKAAYKELEKRERKCVKGNKMYKEDFEITIKLKKTKGVWKVESTSDLRDILDGGYDESWKDFRRAHS